MLYAEDVVLVGKSHEEWSCGNKTFEAKGLRLNRPKGSMLQRVVISRKTLVIESKLGG